MQVQYVDNDNLASLYPIGTCFIAVAGSNGVECASVRFNVSRVYVQKRSASLALDLLRCRCLAIQ